MNYAKQNGKNKIDGKIVFRLYDTYGFPPEMTQELAKENNIEIDLEEFNKLFKEHQEKSRLGSEQKFKGGLADQNVVFLLLCLIHFVLHVLLILFLVKK